MKRGRTRNTEVYHALRSKLLNWFDRNRRPLPWRLPKPDPYRTWLSEVMLQQTRVAAAEPFYRRFLRRFPSVEALARARPQSVLRAWAGLGYYSRARMLHETARRICARGSFPRTFQEWLELPGIGPYTAAAITSIAFGQPHAVVDGNVRRVISRLFACQDSFQQRAQALLARARPGDFNQAMMELGATVCLPQAPLCTECPLQADCRAFRARAVDRFPPPKRKTALTRLDLRLALVEDDGRILLARPGNSGLWPRFWTLPQLPDAALERGRKVAEFRHTVTFRDLRIQVFRARAVSAPPEAMRFIDFSRLARLPLSTPTRKALRLANGRCGPGQHVV